MSARVRIRRLGTTALAGSLLLWAPAPSLPAAPRLVPGAPPLRGLVVCEGAGGVRLARLGEPRTTLLAPGGAWPRLSPDGRQVAFLRGRDVMVTAVDGGAARRLAEAAQPRALAFGPGGGSVLFTDGGAVRAADVRSGAVTTVLGDAGALELDAAPDGTIVFTTHGLLGFAVRAYDPVARRGWRVADGCSASLSPDGRLVTCNTGDHRRLALVGRAGGSPAASLAAPPGLRIDNQFWSNHPDWIVGVQEGQGAILVQQISTGMAWRVVEGGCDRPDLFVLP